MHHVLNGCEIEPLDGIAAKAGGQLLGSTGTSDIVDASVVVLARRYEASVVTSDPGDIGRLAVSMGWAIPLFVI
jgi:hypothetical protein